MASDIPISEHLAAAERVLSQPRAVSPSNFAWALLVEAMDLERCDERERALAYYDRFLASEDAWLQNDTGPAIALIRRAYLLDELDRFHASLAAFDRCLAELPDGHEEFPSFVGDALWGRAHALWQLGRKAEARVEVERIIEFCEGAGDDPAVVALAEKAAKALPQL